MKNKYKTQKQIEERTKIAEQQHNNALRELRRKSYKTEKELKRLKRHKKMYSQFREMMDRSDFENRCLACEAFTATSGPSLVNELISTREGVPSLLDDYTMYFCGQELNARKKLDFEGEKKFSKLRDLVYDHLYTIAKRTMTQDTYENLLNGTEPTLGPYLDEVIKDKISMENKK